MQIRRPVEEAALPSAKRRQFSAAEDVFGHSKRGCRPDLGAICFRSSWEANYARYLRHLEQEGVIADWDYEPDTFHFGGSSFGPQIYTPDFKVTAPDGAIAYHEVKGWLDRGSRARLARMRRCFPEVTLVLIGPREYAAIGAWAALECGWE
jgi:hypothetical protein